MIDPRIIQWQQKAREKLRALGLEDAWPIYERLTIVHGSVKGYWDQPEEDRKIESVVNHLVTHQTITEGQVRLLRVMMTKVRARSK